MQELLSLEFSIFSMMAVGFILKMLNIVGEGAEKTVSGIVISVVLPCNIVLSFMVDMTDNMISDCLWVIALSTLIQIIAVIYSKIAFRNCGKDEYCNLYFAMICSNASFLGNPISEGVFGSYGLMIASIYLIPQRFMMWSAGLAAYSGMSDKAMAFKKIITHPCVIACVTGFVCMIFRISFPDFILSPVQLLGRCNTALSMMAVGMVLCKIDLRSVINKTVVAYTIHRLVIMPLIIYVICLFLPVGKTVSGVSVLLAAMPAGATTGMLAVKYERKPEFAANLIFFSTVCSVPAIIVWSVILTM